MRPRGDYGPMWNHPYVVERGHDHAHHPLWWLLLFLLIALIVALVVWIVLRAGWGRPPAPQVVAAGPADDALEVVRMRYARGEIDRDDFLRVSGDLGGQPLPPAPPPEPSPAPSA